MFSFFKKKEPRTERGLLERIAMNVMSGDEQTFRSAPPELHALTLALYSGFQSVDGQTKIKGHERRFASANRDILACQFLAYLMNRTLASIAPRYLFGDSGEEPEVADLVEDAWHFFPTLIEQLRENTDENEVSYLDGFEVWYQRVRQEYYNKGLTRGNKHHFDPVAALDANISAAISAKSFRDIAEPPEFQLVSERGLLDDIYRKASAGIYGNELIPGYLKSLRRLLDLLPS